jgi:hypothetical protein
VLGGSLLKWEPHTNKNKRKKIEKKINKKKKRFCLCCDGLGPCAHVVCVIVCEEGF